MVYTVVSPTLAFVVALVRNTSNAVSVADGVPRLARGSSPHAGMTRRLKSQGKICTTEFIGGSCLIERVPLTTISITVTHSDYVELKRDVVMQIGFRTVPT